jgi:hypothetical protein
MPASDIRYYFEFGPYPKSDTRIQGAIPGTTGTATQHLTLEGSLQNFLDGIHMELRSRADAARYGSELDGAWGEQTKLPYVIAQVEALGRFWPRMYPDSVPAGKTAEQIVAQYKNDAQQMFAAYGMD